MLSERTFYLLSIIPEHGLPEDQFPDHKCRSDYVDLESRGFVRVCTLVPPGTESQLGMCYVVLTSAGRDELAHKLWYDKEMNYRIDRQKADEQFWARYLADQERRERENAELHKKNRREDRRTLWFQWIISTLIAIAAFKSDDVLAFLRRCIERIWSMLH